MNKRFWELYEKFESRELIGHDFLKEIWFIGDFKEDMLAGLRLCIQESTWDRISMLIVAVQERPSSDYVPLLAELLDRQGDENYMEDVADALQIMGDERAVPSLIRALDYHLDIDHYFQFNRKVIRALLRIGAPDAIRGIENATKSRIPLVSSWAKHELGSLRLRKWPCNGESAKRNITRLHQQRSETILDTTDK